MSAVNVGPCVLGLTVISHSIAPWIQNVEQLLTVQSSLPFEKRRVLRNMELSESGKSDNFGKLSKFPEIPTGNIRDCRFLGFPGGPETVLSVYPESHRRVIVSRHGHRTWRKTECLEKVQRSATTMVGLHGVRHLAYEQRLYFTWGSTLQERQIRGDLIETFKIMTGIREAVDRDQVFQLCSWVQVERTQHDAMKLSKPWASLDVRKFSFSQRVVQGNKLPQEVVDATSVYQFKKRLDKFWQRYGH